MDRRNFLKCLGLGLPAAFAKMTVPADVGANNKAAATGEDKYTYTLVVKFADNSDGRMAWYVWKKMSNEQKRNTGLLDIKLGGTVFAMPGMSFNVIEGGYERIILEAPKEDTCS